MDPDQVLLVLSQGPTTLGVISQRITPWTDRVFDEMRQQGLVRVWERNSLKNVMLTEEGRSLFRVKLDYPLR